MRYSQTELVCEKEGDEPIECQFVELKDMPMVIFEVFCGQPDQKRIDAAELIQRY